MSSNPASTRTHTIPRLRAGGSDGAVFRTSKPPSKRRVMLGPGLHRVICSMTIGLTLPPIPHGKPGFARFAALLPEFRQTIVRRLLWFHGANF